MSTEQREFYTVFGCYHGDYMQLCFVSVCVDCHRTGDEHLLMSILTPLNVNGHACDGRKVKYKS